MRPSPALGLQGSGVNSRALNRLIGSLGVLVRRCWGLGLALLEVDLGVSLGCRKTGWVKHCSEHAT